MQASKILTRTYLIIVCKFIRPDLDDRDNIYDQAYNNSFLQKLEYICYNFALELDQEFPEKKNDTGILLAFELSIANPTCLKIFLI